MKTAKERMQKHMHDEIGRVNRRLEKLDFIPVNLIQEAFPTGSWSSFVDLEFTLPMSFATIEIFLEFMQIQFPEIRKVNDRSYVWGDTNPPAAARCFTFANRMDAGRDAYFEVDFRSNMAGATCVLNPIGKTTKEVIEYEVVCSQEAANEFTLTD